LQPAALAGRLPPPARGRFDTASKVSKNKARWEAATPHRATGHYFFFFLVAFFFAIESVTSFPLCLASGPEPEGAAPPRGAAYFFFGAFFALFFAGFFAAIV